MITGLSSYLESCPNRKTHPQEAPAPAVTGNGKRETGNASGFSLIEVLVATALLVMIVGMIGFVFRQSSMSWDSGIRRADGIAQVRAVAGAIERDLRLAVDAREFGWKKGFESSNNSLSFIILAEPEESPKKQNHDRALMKIDWSASGKTVTRKATYFKRTSGSWGADTSSEIPSKLIEPPSDSADSVPTISFEVVYPEAVDPNEDPEDGLPSYVSISADVEVSESFSGLEVRSYGPNGKKNAGNNGDGDDIVVK